VANAPVTAVVRPVIKHERQGRGGRSGSHATLPTNLSGPEIAGQLYVSHNTVRTHTSHLYAKLGTHTRAEAVARARALGLLAPSPLRGQATRPG
jgi:hypothetical protein